MATGKKKAWVVLTQSRGKWVSVGQEPNHTLAINLATQIMAESSAPVKVKKV